MKTIIIAVITLFGSLALAHPPKGSRCAVAYSGEDFTGSKIVIRDGREISNLRHARSRGGYRIDMDNRISSLKVMPGCELALYQYRRFGVDERSGDQIGWVESFRAGNKRKKRVHYLPRYQDNRASSLECSCL